MKVLGSLLNLSCSDSPTSPQGAGLPLVEISQGGDRLGGLPAGGAPITLQPTFHSSLLPQGLILSPPHRSAYLRVANSLIRPVGPAQGQSLPSKEPSIPPGQGAGPSLDQKRPSLWLTTKRSLPYLLLFPGLNIWEQRLKDAHVPTNTFLHVQNIKLSYSGLTSTQADALIGKVSAVGLRVVIQT